MLYSRKPIGGAPSHAIPRAHLLPPVMDHAARRLGELLYSRLSDAMSTRTLGHSHSPRPSQMIQVPLHE